MRSGTVRPTVNTSDSENRGVAIKLIRLEAVFYYYGVIVRNGMLSRCSKYRL